MVEDYVEIQGTEKKVYLNTVDNYLSLLAKTLKNEQDPLDRELIKAFGSEKEWNWNRLGDKKDSYQQLSDMVNEVRNSLSFFGYIYSENPLENRGYFDKINVSTDSGMVWPYDFMKLHRLKTDHSKELAKLPEYRRSSKKLLHLLMTDEAEMDTLDAEIDKIHIDAMKRNFLETLHQEDIIGWHMGNNRIDAKKKMQIGGETLWNIKTENYSPETGTYLLYIIDLWQDISENPHIMQSDDGTVQISQGLKYFALSKRGPAYHVLRSLDESFENIHPVHAVKATIGPFDSKYQHKKANQLKISKKLLKEDPNFNLLRSTLQYAYSPNHEQKDDVTRQVIHLDDWKDEFIVCPSNYSAEVSTSLLGSGIHIIDA